LVGYISLSLTMSRCLVILHRYAARDKVLYLVVCILLNSHLPVLVEILCFP
jgi:hypothetical protein